MVWLEKHHRIVNELNVFPVPDGDTGTNMLLTMRSAYGQYQRQRGNARWQNGRRPVAWGADGRARQFRRHPQPDLARFGPGLKDKETFNADDLAQAIPGCIRYRLQRRDASS